jgi:hypothetical protein
MYQRSLFTRTKDDKSVKIVTCASTVLTLSSCQTLEESCCEHVNVSVQFSAVRLREHPGKLRYRGQTDLTLRTKPPGKYSCANSALQDRPRVTHAGFTSHSRQQNPQSSANNAAQALAQATLVSITIDYHIRYIDPEQHHERREH